MKVSDRDAKTTARTTLETAKVTNGHRRAREVFTENHGGICDGVKIQLVVARRD